MYKIVRQIITPADRRKLNTYLLEVARSEMVARDDPQVMGAPCGYGDPMTEALLDTLTPAVEALVGTELYPTYSYFRVYRRGDDLARHVDRAACEFTCTLSVSAEPEPWGIWLEADEASLEVLLEPGDALIFRGMELPHWRAPLEGERAAQVFLHYVSRDGPYAEWRFDKRPSLNRPGLLERWLM